MSLLSKIFGSKNILNDILYEKNEEKFTDGNLFVGSCFLVKETQGEYGFILMKIMGVNELSYCFVSVRLNKNVEGIEQFSKGDLRFVPQYSKSEKKYKYYMECLNVVGKNEMGSFINQLSKTGEVVLKEPRPRIGGYSSGNDDIPFFFKFQDMTYEGSKKFVPMINFIKE